MPNAWKVNFWDKEGKRRTVIPDWGDKLTADRFAAGIKRSGRKAIVYKKKI